MKTEELRDHRILPSSIETPNQETSYQAQWRRVHMHTLGVHRSNCYLSCPLNPNKLCLATSSQWDNFN